jgi:hypothetical protein
MADGVYLVDGNSIVCTSTCATNSSKSSTMVTGSRFALRNVALRLVGLLGELDNPHAQLFDDLGLDRPFQHPLAAAREGTPEICITHPYLHDRVHPIIKSMWPFAT